MCSPYYFRVKANFITQKKFQASSLTTYLALPGITTGVVGYMVIITISTVDFGEVKNLSITGKVFTIFLIISYIGIFTYSVSVTATYLFDGDSRKNLK